MNNTQENPIEFRSISLPYVLKRQKDGSYLALNRKYKPIGFITDQLVQYEEYPIAHHFVRLSEKTIQKLAVGGKPDGESIYLYNDGCVPTRSRKNMMAYLEKLAILMKLGVY